MRLYLYLSLAFYLAMLLVGLAYAKPLCTEAETVAIFQVNNKQWINHNPTIQRRKLFVPRKDTLDFAIAPTFKVGSERLVFYLETSTGSYATFYSSNSDTSNFYDILDVLDSQGIISESVIDKGIVSIEFETEMFKCKIIFEHFWIKDCVPQSLIRWQWQYKRGQI